MTAIPTPPMPQFPPDVTGVILYGSCAGAAVVALVLILWGRTLGRGVLALAAAGVGVLVGGPIADLLNSPGMRMPCQVALGITGCALGLVLARVAWALVAAGMFEAVAAALIIWHFLGTMEKGIPEFTLPSGADAVAWMNLLGKFWLDGFEAVRAANFGTLMIITVPAGLLPLMIALLRPKAAAIFSSSLLGAVLMTAALWVAAIQVHPSLWPEDWWRFLIPAGVAAVLMIIGMVYQAHGALVAQREEAKKREEASPPKKKDEDKAYIPKEKKT